MTVRHMKIFIAVYRTQNITHAAEQLYITQPAVTRAIQEIEKYYGIKLFERINQRLYVTETGKEFYANALHIVDSFDSMERNMRNRDEQGIIRVGASITLGNTLMPKVAIEFKRRHPNFILKVIIKNSFNLEAALLDNLLDFALVEGAVVNDRLEKEKFSTDRLLLIVPPDSSLAMRNGLTLAEVMTQPMLLREKGSAGRTFLDSVFSSHGYFIEPEWESSSTRAIVRAVGSGLGISFLPERLVEKDISDGIVKSLPITDEAFIRNNYIVWHKNKFLTESAKELMTICRETVI